MAHKREIKGEPVWGKMREAMTPVGVRMKRFGAIVAKGFRKVLEQLRELGKALIVWVIHQRERAAQKKIEEGGGSRVIDAQAESAPTSSEIQMPEGEPTVSSGYYSGKRVRRSEMRRQEQQKKLRYVIAALCGVVLIAYLVLCGTVCKEEMLPNTRVNGQDLSGMTLEQASEVLGETFQKEYADATLTVEATGKEYTVELGKALDLDAQEVAEKAFAHGHTGFFRRGLVWMFSNIWGYHKTVLPHIGNEETLKVSVEAAGLLKINTAVADSYKVSQKKITFTRGTSGQVVDAEKLYDELSDAVDKGDYESTIACPLTTSAPKALNIKKVYKEVHTEPVNATLDPKNNYEVVDDQKGISFDEKKAAEVIEPLKEGESVSIPLKFTTAEITTQKLKDGLFRDQLGTYTTNVTGTAARLNNVRLAAEHCNGTILLPGETFSYNDVVGERTAARGFQKAGAYLNGETVQELGGGICQVSSTLYCATVLSNLEIVHRENHIYESTYVPLGLDATVSWGGPDYQFKNNTDYPVKVVASYSGGICTCELLGTKTDDITVKFTNDVLETIYYGTVKQEDSSKMQGYSEVTVAGENGYRVQTYRELYNKNGQRISKEKEALSIYRKRDQVIKVGTMVPAPVVPQTPEPAQAAEAAVQATG